MSNVVFGLVGGVLLVCVLRLKWFSVIVVGVVLFGWFMMGFFVVCIYV